jgi:hypothetical protein
MKAFSAFSVSGENGSNISMGTTVQDIFLIVPNPDKPEPNSIPCREKVRGPKGKRQNLKSKFKSWSKNIQLRATHDPNNISAIS